MHERLRGVIVYVVDAHGGYKVTTRDGYEAWIKANPGVKRIFLPTESRYTANKPIKKDIGKNGSVINK